MKSRPHATSTIELLLRGDEEIVSIYREAAEIWRDILQKSRKLDDDKFATLVHDSEARFVTLCRNTQLGYEVMGFSGIGQFCSIHKTAKSLSDAKKVVQVYAAMCNGGVHVETQRAAESMAECNGLDLDWVKSSEQLAEPGVPARPDLKESASTPKEREVACS